MSHIVVTDPGQPIRVLLEDNQRRRRELQAQPEPDRLEVTREDIRMVALQQALRAVLRDAADAGYDGGLTCPICECPISSDPDSDYCPCDER